MKIISARIKNYRTIKDEIEIDLRGGLTIVGPNNAGKTNLLRALELFFARSEYSKEHDLSFGQKAQQTSIIITFSIEKDKDDNFFLEKLKRIIESLNIIEENNLFLKENDFTIYLNFSNASTPIYRMFPNSKRPRGPVQRSNYLALEKDFVEKVLNAFSVYYIPSDKSIEQLYNELILPYLLRKVYSVISPSVEKMNDAMKEASDQLNDSIRMSGIENIECSFRIPSDYAKLFKELDFSIKDPNSTSIFSKGMGIQSTALLASFNWLTNEERNNNKNVLWLLEEPESYLHPKLATQCNNLISELRSHAQVLCTTHSLAFVPQNPRLTLGIQKDGDWSKVRSYKTYTEATNEIRNSLGIKFSDFYNMNRYNVLVEGETDREYLSFLQEIIRKDLGLKKKYEIFTSEDISFLDHGGVTGLEGFLKATYEFIRLECPCLTLFDGDDAGVKTSRKLQKYFGQKKITFASNEHFIILPKERTIEGLFPDEWIRAFKEEYPQALDISSYAEDASGTILYFSVKSEKKYKKQFMEWMIKKSNESPSLEWANTWFDVLSRIEKALEKQRKKIYT